VPQEVVDRVAHALAGATAQRPGIDLLGMRSGEGPPLVRSHCAHTRILQDVTSDEAARKAEARRRLRAALDGAELLPETTTDERVQRPAKEERDRDAEMRRNKPPHHG
jgi:hypothetical protein